ncbi:Apolipoprotein L3 [Myotis davidii]|uniref:Apolipoprotein L3 n=1 Tax=Myotis davidii TaxID=225400 RepID=L5M525_MYODS|nr:Apolipoprotein L3 [Myotis davidii]
MCTSTNKWVLFQISQSKILEGKVFVDVIEYLNDPWNKEKVQRLLSDESWERFVAAAELSRDEADALDADLRQLEALMAVDDKDMPSECQGQRERFMKQFPQVKQDLEECIGKLYALADEVDKVHRDCTITQVVVFHRGIVSGILTIIGLSLAPVTHPSGGLFHRRCIWHSDHRWPGSGTIHSRG